MSNDTLAMMHARQFDLKNGDDGLMIEHWLFFSNGATREAHPRGALCDPPDDPYRCCQNIVVYYREVARRAETAFSEFKAELLSRANDAIRQPDAHTPPEPEDITKLRQLRSLVRKAERLLRDAEKEVEKNLPPHIKARAKIAREFAEGDRDVFDTISGIDI